MPSSTEAARRVVAPVEAIHAAGDRTRERLEPRPIGLGDVEQLGDDADRERVREVGDEVDLGRAGEAGHELLDDRVDARRDRADTRNERRVEERSHGEAVGRVGRDRAEARRRRRLRGARRAAAIGREPVVVAERRRDVVVAEEHPRPELLAPVHGVRGAQGGVVRVGVGDGRVGERVEAHVSVRCRSRGRAPQPVQRVGHDRR